MNKGPPFKTIFFDCDSTLTTLEGIDELAEASGVSDKIQKLTQSAMNGQVSLEDVYSQRLEMIQPSRNAINRLGQRYVENLVTGARNTLQVLQKIGKDVHIISGGILQAVEYLGLELAIPKKNIHAVEIFFDDIDNYLHFDSNNPLSKTNGKGMVCMKNAHVDSSDIAIIGDGVTDLEASQFGIYVIGFGGVQRRKVVEKFADTYIAKPQLDAVLTALLTIDEQKLI